MSALSEKIAQRKFATRDVTICLDGSLSLRRDAAMADVVRAGRLVEDDKNPDARLGYNPIDEAKAVVEAIEDEMRDSSITLRFTAVSFGEYNKFIIQNPPRKGNPVDASFGFNAQEFFMFVARRTGKYVDALGMENDIDVDDWKAIEEALTDGDHDRIANAIIDINRREGSRGVDFLQRKSDATPESSATSESPATTE